MRMGTHSLIGFSALFGAAWASVAAAQTAAELNAAFDRQKAALQSAESEPYFDPRLQAAVLDEDTVYGEDPAAPEAYRPVAKADEVKVRIGFAFDSAQISPVEARKLDALCSVVGQRIADRFKVIGHTDAKGAAAYNQALSERRAASVRAYFVQNCGVAPDRLIALGLGERHLALLDDPNNGANRRVEFQILR